MCSKTCNKCGKEKEIDEFPIRKENKDGHRNICKKCYNEYNKIYKSNNKNVINANARIWYYDNKEKKQIYQKENLIKTRKTKQDYVNNNRIKVNENKRRHYKIKSKIDPTYKLRLSIRSRMLNSLKQKGFKKKTKTVEMLGCSIKEFKLYLESKFEPWMTWENRGLYNGNPNYGWDIDHIIPLASAKTEEDIIKLNHYTNLQPLCSYINRNIKRAN